MDWSKAKNIIIIALIATNLFLLFTYVTKNRAENEMTNQEVVFTVLESKNIYVDMAMPNKYEKMPAINIAYNNESNKSIEKNLKLTAYDLGKQSKEGEYRTAADKFLKDCQLLTENLVYDSVTRKGDTVLVKYKNSYKEIAIGGSFIEVKFVDGKLQDVTRQFLTPKPQSKKKLNIISPEEALLVFMSEKNNNKEVHVKNMQLVFWVNNSEFDGQALVSDTAFPAWEITYNDGEIKYVDAYKT